MIKLGNFIACCFDLRYWLLERERKRKCGAEWRACWSPKARELRVDDDDDSNRHFVPLAFVIYLSTYHLLKREEGKRKTNCNMILGTCLLIDVEFESNRIRVESNRLSLLLIMIVAQYTCHHNPIFYIVSRSSKTGIIEK